MAPPNCTLLHLDVPPGPRTPHPTRSARPGPATDVALDLATWPGPRGEMYVAVVGEIDLCTAPTLLSYLRRAMQHPGCRTLVVDLREVRFLGARGIGTLMTVALDARDPDVRLAVVADHATVVRPLLLTGATDDLALFPTPGAARTSVAPDSTTNGR